MTAPAASVAFKDGARALEAIVTLARGDVRLTAGVTDERVGARVAPFWRVAGTPCANVGQKSQDHEYHDPAAMHKETAIVYKLYTRAQRPV